MNDSKSEKYVRIKVLMPLFPSALFIKGKIQFLENNTLK